jgi:hypothetical protein
LRSGERAVGDGFDGGGACRRRLRGLERYKLDHETVQKREKAKKGSLTSPVAVGVDIAALIAPAAAAAIVALINAAIAELAFIWATPTAAFAEDITLATSALADTMTLIASALAWLASSRACEACPFAELTCADAADVAFAAAASCPDADAAKFAAEEDTFAADADSAATVARIDESTFSADAATLAALAPTDAALAPAARAEDSAEAWMMATEACRAALAELREEMMAASSSACWRGVGAEDGKDVIAGLGAGAEA